ncbi:MAG: hypothetical protein WBC63_07880 [Candidatus Bipolaricaulia bacterium]
MRKTWSRLIVRFAVVFLVCLALFAVFWPRIAPLYTSTIATLARPVFRLVESPNVTVLDVQSDELHVYRKIGEGRIAPVLWFDRYIFFAVVPLIALIMATPGLGIRRRFIRTVGGIAALILLHVGYLVASVELVYGVSAGRALDGWQVAVRILWESAPVLVWIALTAGAWKRVLQSLRAEGIERTGSPSAEPAGAEG